MKDIIERTEEALSSQPDWISAMLAEDLIKEVKRLRASTIHAQVTEFHKAFEQDIGEKPAVPDEKTVRLRVKLVGEEFCEMLDAVFGDTAFEAGHIDAIRGSVSRLAQLGNINVDLVELVDAWGDIDYVVEGSRLAFGVVGQPIADEIQRSNMAKLGPDGKPIIREDGKRLKPPGWTPPDIEGELRKQGWEG